MTTIISRPATPTFIVSTPGAADRVRSVHGRIGDVLAEDNDYGISEIGLFGRLEISTLGFHEDEVIVVKDNKFVLKPLQIGTKAVVVSVPIEGDIVEFDGKNWLNTQPKISGRPVLAAGVQAGEVLTFDGSSWVNFEILTTVGNSIDNNIAAHALVTDDVHGLIDSGAGTLFHSDDGSYKAITHPPDVVTSVFGRLGDVTAAFGDYAISDIAGLVTIGTGLLALFDDGSYKAIVHPPDAIDTVFGRTGDVVAANNDYTLAQIDGLIDSGAGVDVLTDDGTYKTPSAAPPRQVAAATLADSTTIVDGAAHTIIFDFAPLAAFRNNNCLITIYYQGHNLGGPAQWAAWLQSSAGLTVQQNAYSGGVAQDINGDERFALAVTMEAIVSASGNIVIGVQADLRDHDFSNNAANGKTRLVIELA